VCSFLTYLSLALFCDHLWGSRGISVPPLCLLSHVSLTCSYYIPVCHVALSTSIMQSLMCVFLTGLQISYQDVTRVIPNQYRPACSHTQRTFLNIEMKYEIICAMPSIFLYAVTLKWYLVFQWSGALLNSYCYTCFILT